MIQIKNYLLSGTSSLVMTVRLIRTSSMVLILCYLYINYPEQGDMGCWVSKEERVIRKTA